VGIRLKIDGRDIEVPEGATVLDAARRLGIHVPTLCHLDSVPPLASCFLCVVRVKTRANLVPACAAPAEPGMVVVTDSGEIRAARRAALELLLSDHVGDCTAPCTLTCPAGLDIPAMIRHIARGDDRAALEVIRERIALPGVLGRICPRYCERACRRGGLDEPIAVCALKRYAADVALRSPEAYPPSRRPPTGKRVAVVGAGPAGLSAAFHLLREGHDCTLFDARDTPGGMIRHAIAPFRVPHQALEGDLQPLHALGARFEMNTPIASGEQLERLRADFDAVFLAMGASALPSLQCEGHEHAEPVLTLLRHAGDAPSDRCRGARVVVIGGGNEAVEGARVAVRLGAGQVTILCEKGRRAVPCFSEALEAAEEEGVEVRLETQTDRIERRADGTFEVHCSGTSHAVTLAADIVIAAPVRRPDLDLLRRLGQPVTARGAAADPHTLATPVEGVFTGGEVVSGAGAAVRAVAAGRRAAISIGHYLRGEPFARERKPFNTLMRDLSDDERKALYAGIAAAPRARQSGLGPAERRSGFREVVAGLAEEDARTEAARCLQCDCPARDTCKLRRYAAEYGARASRYGGERRALARDTSHPEVVFEAGKCIVCGLCVRIAEQAGARPGIAFTGRGFPVRTDVPFGGNVAEGLGPVAARCAAACPTGALSLKRKAVPEKD